MTRGVVEQLGMETIPWWFSRSPALTSGTIRGTLGSMRKTELSSMTRAPAAAATGARALLTAPLAEMKTMSVLSKAPSPTVSTTRSSPATVMRLPTERSEANRRMDEKGNPRCSRMLRKTSPTAPVAPTTAMLGAPMPTFSLIQDSARGIADPWGYSTSPSLLQMAWGRRPGVSRGPRRKRTSIVRARSGSYDWIPKSLSSPSTKP